MTLFFIASLAHAALQETPVLPPAFCQALIKHKPDADVVYQPGIDVNGKPVVSADLNSRPSLLSEDITFPLTADLLSVAGLDTSLFPFSAMKRSDVPVGELRLKDGKILLNGTPLSDEQQDNLAVLCLVPTKDSAR